MSKNQTISLSPDEVKEYVRKLNDLSIVLGDIRSSIGKQTASVEDGWNDDNYRLLQEAIEDNSKVLDNIQNRIFDFCQTTNCYADIIDEARRKYGSTFTK
jgi:hypothetical protein